MAKIVVVADGQTRLPIDIARDFVREQAAGEWDDQTIERDAKSLARVLNAFGAASTGLWPELDTVVEYDG